MKGYTMPPACRDIFNNAQGAGDAQAGRWIGGGNYANGSNERTFLV